jgi:hypothetical protein
MHRLRNWILGTVILFLLAAAAATLAQTGGGELFTDLSPEALQSVGTDNAGAEVLRTRYAGVDLRLTERLSPGDRLVLHFFEDAVYTLVVDEVQHWGEFLSLVGPVEGLDNSLVAITIGDGQLVVDLIAPQAIYQVRFVDDGVYAIHQIDQSAFPDELTPVEVPAMKEPPLESTGLALSGIPPAPQADDGSQIDVLVMYTAAARIAAGGTTGIQNLIANAFAVTNQSYAASGVIQRLNPAGYSETSYVETGNMEQDLINLRNGGVANAHTLRDQYQADLVSLIVASGQYCGIAYQLGSASDTGFASWAFSVVLRECTVSNLSLPHELGHNMGARHDWFVDSATNPFRYSHGHLNLADRWRTIMSYNDYCDCSDEVFPCPSYDARRTKGSPVCDRIPRWSNPSIFYNSDPLGVPEFTCTGSVGCDADNARTLNNTRVTVANFRVHSSPTPTQTQTPTVTPTPTPTLTPTPTPPYKVLLVDDKGDLPEVLGYYATPLATLKATVTVWDTGPINSNLEPSAAQMAPHEAVIWFTGDNFSTSTGPSAASEEQLATWLQAGGCLFLSSQDYAFAYQLASGFNPPNLFMANYLGVQSIYNDVSQASVLGSGSPFSGFGPYVLTLPAGFAGNYSDTIIPGPKAGVAFQGSNGPAAVFYEAENYKTTYWGFPFEMIPSVIDRTAILKRFLFWCRYNEVFIPAAHR